MTSSLDCDWHFWLDTSNDVDATSCGGVWHLPLHESHKWLFDGQTNEWCSIWTLLTSVVCSRWIHSRLRIGGKLTFNQISVGIGDSFDDETTNIARGVDRTSKSVQNMEENGKIRDQDTCNRPFEFAWEAMYNQQNTPPPPPEEWGKPVLEGRLINLNEIFPDERWWSVRFEGPLWLHLSKYRSKSL